VTERLAGGVLLAAGEGRRFGGPKALAELDGELLVERGVTLLADGGCADVVVVLGAAADEVLDRARLGPARPVVNQDWATGMGSSLVAGLRALQPETGAAVVALADQPLVGPGAVRRLRAAWAEGAIAAVATYDGRPRNPVLLDRSVWAQVCRDARGDIGARDFLRSNAHLVTAVECGDTGAPDDVDTAGDLLAIVKGRP
jgi:nicotine blue oxidoreductase